MAEQLKSVADQVSEIAKLVADVQDRLDQVTRALKTLEGRLSQVDRSRAGGSADSAESGAGA